MQKIFRATAFFAILFLFISSHASAQSLLPFAGENGAETQDGVSLPDPLTREAIRDVLSGIDDSQARQLLLQELEKQVAAREAELQRQTEQSLGTAVSNLVGDLGRSLYEPVEVAPSILPAVEKLITDFLAGRGDASIWLLPFNLLMAVACGVALTWLVSFAIRKKEALVIAKTPETLWGRIGIIFFRFLMQGLRVVTFMIGGIAYNEIANASVPNDQELVRILGAAIGWTFLAFMIGRFFLSPKRPDLRLCHVDDEGARFLTWRIGLIFGWSAFSLGILFKLQIFGWTLGETRLGFWLNVIFTLLIIVTIWQGRGHITKMVAGPDEITPLWRRLADAWPYIAIGLIAAQWLIVEIFVATGNLQFLSLTAINITCVIILVLPLLEHTIPALVRGTWIVSDDATDTEKKIGAIMQESGVRCTQLAVFILILALLSWLWGFSFSDIASQNAGTQFAGALTAIFFILLVSFGIFEFVTVATERKMIRERAALEEKDPTSAAYGLTRLETVLPLVRVVVKVVVVVIAGLAILAQLGINILPLLAGAGVAGIAIGFGAQALVRDIISGIFFLIDDAFRKDEYIDIGTCMGTVEKLSIRSMQIRHHDGLLNTVPFGEIKQVTNYSRDWGIMRLLLRVPYDTDVLRLAELINELGEQLMDDPEIGEKFTVKLTSQGVIDTDDSALIFRVAYMTKALDQWAMRGQVYAKIREMFDREGIKFAAREVTVRVTGDEGDPITDDTQQKIAAAAHSVVSAEGKI
ncbi:MAG: mechanosensitive ion channel domain-containing protein [Pseudomonadota bacterium]